MAELMGILEGMKIAKKDYRDQIMIVSDCKNVIEMLNQDHDYRDVLMLTICIMAGSYAELL